MNHQRPVHRRLRIDAQATADASGTREGPVSLLIEIEEPEPQNRPHDGTQTRVVRSARLLAVGDQSLEADEVIDRPGAVLIPGLVNAHSHLDLTAIGPIPHEPADGFVSWIQRVRDLRPSNETEIRSSVAEGVRLSLAGGVVAVGDIAGAVQGRPSLFAAEALSESPLWGTSYVELFGIGVASETTLAALPDLAGRVRAWRRPRLRLGLEPHAPYSVAPDVFEAVAALGLPLATHLAESPEESRFVAEGVGPMRKFLEMLDLWDEGVAVGAGRTPVGHLDSFLRSAGSRSLVVHCNNLSKKDIQILVNARAMVAYCPRASAYFDAPGAFGPHRYQELFEAGVEVCLGTDSILNLDTPDRISPLDDARLIY
ncbi:MAG: amidohydrolase family protein, partial [Planctomycetota bacterium]